MTNPITTLACPSCGGKLQIKKSANRSTCGYCGNEHVVHRESGTAYLEPVAEDVRYIRSAVDTLRGGTDKAAAELAIPRFTKEIGELKGKLETVKLSDMNSLIPVPRYESTLLLVTVLSFCLIPFYPSITLLFGICLILLIVLWKRRETATWNMKLKATKDVEKEIENKKALIEKNRMLLD